MNNIDIKRLENQLISSSNSRKTIKPKKDFNQILDQIKQKEEIKFSKHASERLNTRNMNLTNVEMDRLRSAFNRAEEKGVRDALILMDDKAFIANIQNKVVVTTVNKDQLKDNIFTNIDGAIII